MTDLPHVRVSSFDIERLERVIASTGGPEAARLEDELMRAEVIDVAAVPPTLVTMNSRVRYRDELAETEHTITLVFPHEADASQGRVSILAPIASALLGLTVGDAIEWPVPRDRTTRLRVLGLEYQPEAAGDLRR
ncbi:MAG: nucleoside diphosphate kinase regulator [Deltaproteobacteria bacterium]|nr:nucleoside diphosphate kinase regulator [Deltaproteobacteria bacterium]